MRPRKVKREREKKKRLYSIRSTHFLLELIWKLMII